jgi:hypothetical protein
MPKTYTPIATQKLTTSAASITFSSVPATYTDLVIVSQPIYTTSGCQYYVQYNSDTANNYSDTVLYGNGTAAASGRDTNYFAHFGNISSPNSTAEVQLQNINIMNYSNTTTFKTTIIRASEPAQGVGAYVGLWRSTAAINSIKIYPSTSTFAAGTIMTLYGILKA